MSQAYLTPEILVCKSLVARLLPFPILSLVCLCPPTQECHCATHDPPWEALVQLLGGSECRWVLRPLGGLRGHCAGPSCVSIQCRHLFWVCGTSPQHYCSGCAEPQAKRTRVRHTEECLKVAVGSMPRVGGGEQRCCVSDLTQ